MSEKKKLEHENGGTIILQTHFCADCKEALVMNDKAYCSIDGHFHPLHSIVDCKNFISRNNNSPVH